MKMPNNTNVKRVRSSVSKIYLRIVWHFLRKSRNLEMCYTFQDQESLLLAWGLERREIGDHSYRRIRVCVGHHTEPKRVVKVNKHVLNSILYKVQN